MSTRSGSSSELTPAQMGCQRVLLSLNGGAPTGERSGEMLCGSFQDLLPSHRQLAWTITTCLGLTPSAAMKLVDAQRDLLRAGGMRRSDDIEILTALVRLLMDQPLTSKQAVCDVHEVYDHLRRRHWWPTGPEDLPLCALVAARPGGVESAITHLIELQQTLAEGDDVPDDAIALVALLWSPQSTTPQVLVERMRDLRTALILGGVALLPTDGEALTILGLADGVAEELVTHYLAARRIAVAAAAGQLPPESFFACADEVVLPRLDESHRIVVIATLIIRSWMALHRATSLESRTAAYR